LKTITEIPRKQHGYLLTTYLVHGTDRFKTKYKNLERYKWICFRDMQIFLWSLFVIRQMKSTSRCNRIQALPTGIWIREFPWRRWTYEHPLYPHSTDSRQMELCQGSNISLNSFLTHNSTESLVFGPLLLLLECLHRAIDSLATSRFCQPVNMTVFSDNQKQTSHIPAKSRIILISWGQPLSLHTADISGQVGNRLTS
jgi:hypothetical protein